MGIAHSNFCLFEPFGSVTVQAYAVVVDAHTHPSVSELIRSYEK